MRDSWTKKKISNSNPSKVIFYHKVRSVSPNRNFPLPRPRPRPQQSWTKFIIVITLFFPIFCEPILVYAYKLKTTKKNFLEGQKKVKHEMLADYAS